MLLYLGLFKGRVNFFTTCFFYRFISSQSYDLILHYTICPGSIDPFNILVYYIEWVTTSWSYSNSCQKRQV